MTTTHPIFDIWNDEAQPQFPIARKLTPSRRLKCDMRWKETPGEGTDARMIYWMDLIRSCKGRDFLTGHSKRGWVMDFDYLIANDTNHVRLSEGRWLDKKRSTHDDRPAFYHATPETRAVIGVCAQCRTDVEGTKEQARRWVKDKSTCSACFVKSPEYQKARLGGSG